MRFGYLKRLWADRKRRLVRLALVAMPVVAALAGVALAVLVVGQLLGGSEPEARPRPEVVRPTPTVTPIPSDAPLERLVVRKIGLDAPVEILAVDGGGVIRSSTGPEVVSLYDFSSYNPDFGGWPGFGRNAVFGGHVDYHNYGPAVFRDLSELSEGDEVDVRLTDGTVYRYVVKWNETYPWSDMPWEHVLKSEDDRETVTLMTCSGVWTGSEYTDARVVRAERVYRVSSLSVDGS